MDLAGRVLHRDGLILVVDKPTGVPVHAGPGGGPNLEQGFAGLRFGRRRSPALAHRLDRDTSGCLVLGRHPKALRRLGGLFAEGRVEKTYWALVGGVPPAPEGRVEAPLLKREGRRGWRIVTDPGGKPARTDYRLLAQHDGISWLELRPLTGRTHQIRVHMAELGCPILGDTAYGGRSGERPLLHSRAIALPLYPGRPPVRVEAPPPSDMAWILAAASPAPPPA